MASVNRDRIRLSLALTALFVLPIFLSTGIALFDHGGESLEGRVSSVPEKDFDPYLGDLGVAETDDPSHGWIGQDGVGEALLYHRKATYVPIQDWQTTTGEQLISGWHVLGHEYPIPSNWKEDLGDLGMECNTFFSPQGFHCNVPRISPNTLMDYGVIGAFRMDPSDKLAPDLLPIVIGQLDLGALMVDEKFVINVLLSGDGHEQDLSSGPIQIEGLHGGRFAQVISDEDGMEWLSKQNFVEWIEPEYPARLMNDIAADYINVDWAAGGESWQCRDNEDVNSDDCSSGTYGLTGDGVIVGVMDSGLDTAVECSSLSTCTAANAGVHGDVAGRIQYVESFYRGSCSDDGPNDPNGHGTHVVGSVLGDGSTGHAGSDDVHSGMAPGAHLYMQSVLCYYVKSNGELGGGLYTPTDYEEDIFGAAYDFGVRVHTNSWGVGPEKFSSTDECTSLCPNYYSSKTLEVDESANSMEDLMILYAMGNDGRDANSDGEISAAYMNRQATAKNILSVGASETYRPGLSSSYGESCTNPNCDPLSTDRFPEDPVYSDTMDFNTEGVAAFSNRGPTEDGRLKPDIVAPGTLIVSMRSTFDGDLISSSPDANCVEVYSGDNVYCYNTGTSMATPITAGSVALVIEHLNDEGLYNCVVPSLVNCPDSALIKALMVAGAYDLDGQYTYGGDGLNGATEAAPNIHEGWGRVDMKGTVEAIDGNSFSSGIDISTGESHSFMLSVPIGQQSLKTVLSWNDPANSPSALKQLQNDLDIFLKNPSGDLVNYANDDVNNLLGITVDSPEAGDWEIIIVGQQVGATLSQKYYVASNVGVLKDMRHPISDTLNSAGFQSGSILTETSLSVGGDHFCTILDDSSPQCWGDNSFGQLGDGTNTDRLTMTPVSLEDGRSAISISSGESHTCAVLDDSTLKCWGRNQQGQLGDGSNTHSNSPVSVTGLADYPVQISSGRSHTCALLVDASLQCWGDNTYGQLGQGSESDYISSPQTVSFGSDKVLAVSAGGDHTCAILDDRSLKCWGDNGDGQLGIDSGDESKNSPQDVPFTDYIVAVSLGESHSCVITDDKDVRCWGDNTYGQLGTGDQVSQDSPASIAVGNSISIDAGLHHTCAIDDSDALWCWGRNQQGQLGDGSNTMSANAQNIDIGSVLGAISIAAGGSFSCVTATNDLLRCWGGEGMGSMAIGSSPVEVDLPRWAYINSAERNLDYPSDSILNIFDTHTGGDTDGDGFGSSDSYPNNPALAANCNPGEYGRYLCSDATVGFYVSSSGSFVMTPARSGHYVNGDRAVSDEPCPTGTFQALTGQTSCDPSEPGYYVDLEGQSSGTPCPGGTFNPDYGSESGSDCSGASPGHNVPILTSISSGSYHTCAILDDGSVSCWGDNTYGQLGDGTRNDHLEPDKALLPIGKTASTVSSGSYHTCAILSDGSLRCWGDNTYGQLGDGTTIERIAPTNIYLGSGRTAIAVSAGEAHTCAVLDDGSMKCWGDNSNGQLGDGSDTSSLSPIRSRLGGGDTSISVSSGSYHTCALTDDRLVKCWGDNWHGQLGTGNNIDSYYPTEINLSSNSSAVTLSSGSFHTCVGMNDGSTYCWGFNSLGQLGAGSTENSNTPFSVLLNEAQLPTMVSSGLYHSCALFDIGSISCWGGNSRGQLGDGSQADSDIPSTVDLPMGKTALSISVGQRHSCAILDDATLYCWGFNSDGQLGDGSVSDSSSPVIIDLNHGSGAQIECSPGTFQPNASQTSCILAERGYYVALSGSLNQTGCNKGQYTSLKGQSSCALASIGFYVDEILSDSQTPCPEQHSTLTTGSNNFDRCIPDFDGDMIPDDIDNDDDNDGVNDLDDYDSLDPNVSIDSDGDDIPDSIDSDDDNDGVNDTMDLFPSNREEWEDADQDGIGDNSDSDDDGDGRNDMFDVFPNDPTEWSDFDGDGIGDNADEDDDNDGVNDVDNNPYVELDDAFPLDSTEWIDTDKDSIGNNADDDDDGDGFLDEEDAFPLDPDEWMDSDGDTFGDNFDWDDDDPFEWMDSDGDQIGDNADVCPDEAGLNESYDHYTHKLAKGALWGCVYDEDNLLANEVVNQTEEDPDDIVGRGRSNLVDTDGDGIFDKNDDDDDSCGTFAPRKNSTAEHDYWESPERGNLKCNPGYWPGDRIPDSLDTKYPTDPNRPFSDQVWVVIVVSFGFMSFMGYRLSNWKKRQLAKLRSKRIRLG